MQLPANIEVLAPDDDAALDALIAFSAQHGTPRTATARAYRERTASADHSVELRAVADGETCAAAFLTIVAATGLDTAVVNGFGAPGDDVAFAAVLDAAASWAREHDATKLVAYVTDPTGEELDRWRNARFEHAGERQRVVREVTVEEALEPGAIDGAEIVALRDRSELVDDAERLWSEGHADVPSALAMGGDDLPSMRSELKLTDADALPPLVLVAATPEGEVIGLALAVQRSTDDPSRVGHRMTAVARDHRGRGIAMALKRELLRRGRDTGVTAFEATNDEGNAAMRAINAKLGYRVTARMVLLERTV